MVRKYQQRIKSDFRIQVVNRNASNNLSLIFHSVSSGRDKAIATPCFSFAITVISLHAWIFTILYNPHKLSRTLESLFSQMFLVTTTYHH